MILPLPGSKAFPLVRARKCRLYGHAFTPSSMSWPHCSPSQPPLCFLWSSPACWAPNMMPRTCIRFLACTRSLPERSCPVSAHPSPGCSTFSPKPSLVCLPLQFSPDRMNYSVLPSHIVYVFVYITFKGLAYNPWIWTCPSR